MVSTNCYIYRVKSYKTWFRKKKLWVQFLKVEKGYDFDKAIVLETKMFVGAKHLEVLKNQNILQNQSTYLIFKK